LFQALLTTLSRSVQYVCRYVSRSLVGAQMSLLKLAVFISYFTVWQVEAKWKNIIKKYRDVIDHNKISGNDRRTCPFFGELDEVLTKVRH